MSAPKYQQIRIRSAADYTREETYVNTRLPVEEAMTLIPDAYRSQEFYDIECQRIWNGGWVCVGYTSQVAKAGDIVTFDLLGQSYFLTRDKQGTLHCYHNVCRHRGSRLVEQDCHKDVIRCPYHSWGYALDGRLLGAPYFKGLDVADEHKAAFETNEAKGFCKDDFPLLSVRVDVWKCFIYVNVDGQARPLAEWLGDLPEKFSNYPLEDYVLVRRRPFTIQANWKLIAENFMEYYHLPWVHPELCNISGFKDHYRFQGAGMYTGMVTWPVSQAPDIVKFNLPDIPGLSEFEARTAFWMMVCPNTAWFLLQNHFFLLNFKPDGPTRTIESADMLVHKSALEQPDAQERIDRILNFWVLVNNQDIGAVEDVQRGLMSKAYPGGRMCYRFEEPVHRFQNMVIDLMVGKVRMPAGDVQEDLPTTALAGR